MFLRTFLLMGFIAYSLAIVPFSDQDETIFVFGKLFYRNGKPNQSTNATEARRFSQCMDHFNSSGCTTKWSQRYWIRDDYYVEGGPIFFHFGGQEPADDLIDNYYWHNYARHYHAKLVVLEHRFYGDSYPSRDNSMEVLELLTSQQALADAAYFIEEYSKTNSLIGNKWVAFGASYSANLAAWMKQKYPNHVTAALASSAPLHVQFDVPEFTETLAEVAKAVDRDCFDKVFEAFNCMESLVNGSSCGSYTSASQIIPGLRQCESVDFGDVLNRETFFLNLVINNWANNWPSAGIRRNCALLKELNGTDPIAVYGDFLVETGSGGNCKIRSKKDHSSKNMLKFVNSEEGRAAGAAGWLWQSCYEFGLYMSSDPKHGLFGFSTLSGRAYHNLACDQFGSRFTTEYTQERIKMTNEHYKAREIDSKCVIFVNGSWDPWHRLGINNAAETSADNFVVHIPGAEHCDDLMDPKIEAMVPAQAAIQDQIGRFLKDPKC